MKFDTKYPLSPFQSVDFSKIKSTIKQFSLATIITQRDLIPLVSQVPLYLIEEQFINKLVGHFDNNNPHVSAFIKNENVYCLFHGPNHYITPSIYPVEQYPGWNFVTVHIEGKVKLIADIEKLREHLILLGEKNEPADSSYRLKNTQTNFAKFSKQVTGFEIEILSAKAVIKLAQDKGPELSQIAKRHLATLSQIDQTPYLDEMLL